MTLRWDSNQFGVSQGYLQDRQVGWILGQIEYCKYQSDISTGTNDKRTSTGRIDIDRQINQTGSTTPHFEWH